MALKQENQSAGQRLEQVVVGRVEAILSTRLDTVIARSINHRHGGCPRLPFNSTCLEQSLEQYGTGSFVAQFIKIAGMFYGQ